MDILQNWSGFEAKNRGHCDCKTALRNPKETLKAIDYLRRKGAAAAKRALHTEGRSSTQEKIESDEINREPIWCETEDFQLCQEHHAYCRHQSPIHP
jgi:hypothetical protein